MKVFILSAGLGTRMMPLTKTRPKPLIEAAGVPLLVRHLRQLRQYGFDEFIINTSVFADQFEQLIGDGRSEKVRVRFSHEGDAPLNTADGIRAAMHLLGESPFLLVNADSFANIDYAQLKLNFDRLAHLVLTANPAHNPDGDFTLATDNSVQALRPPADHPDSPERPERPDSPERPTDTGASRYTYTGIAVLSPALLLESYALEFNSLTDVLALAATHQLVSAEIHDGFWLDVGTPERLRALERHLGSAANSPDKSAVSLSP